MRKEELKKLELYSEKDECGRVEYYYLKAEYEVITEYKKLKVIIDKILLPISGLVIKQESAYSRYPCATVNFGFDDLPVLEPIKEEILEEYPQKMTLKEIEKKLGYKVEIVSCK